MVGSRSGTLDRNPGFHPLPPLAVREVLPHTAFRQPSAHGIQGLTPHLPARSATVGSTETGRKYLLAAEHSLRWSSRDVYYRCDWLQRACPVTYLPARHG